MLAELAIANAAFAVIKNTLNNGKDILEAGDSLGKYFGAEKAINKEVETRGKNTAWEAHEAQFTLRKQQEELRFLLNKREINGWINWVHFKADWYRNEKEVAKEEARARQKRQMEIEENINQAFKALGVILMIAAALFGVAMYMRT